MSENTGVTEGVDTPMSSSVPAVKRGQRPPLTDNVPCSLTDLAGYVRWLRAGTSAFTHEELGWLAQQLDNIAESLLEGIPIDGSLEEAEERVLQDREGSYGDAGESHRLLGHSWTALLEKHYGIELDHPIPSHVVLLMQAENKIHRAVQSAKKDDFVDGRNYIRLAYEAWEDR